LFVDTLIRGVKGGCDSHRGVTSGSSRGDFLRNPAAIRITQTILRAGKFRHEKTFMAIKTKLSESVVVGEDYLLGYHIYISEDVPTLLNRSRRTARSLEEDY
jgi:hypothetical protein